jgi:hypothetical protein
MDLLARFKIRLTVLTAALVFLTSCGGGTTTAGAGGSGIGGTGITATVNGNVAQVVAQGPSPDQGGLPVRMLAAIIDLFAARVNAQTGGVGGIGVQGGNQQTVTDSMGRFSLPNATPSDNFQIVLTFPDAQQIGFNIGSVPPGSTVQVSNIVVNKSRNTARPSAVNVERRVERDDSASTGRDDDVSHSEREAGEQPDDVSEEETKAETTDDAEDSTDDDTGSEDNTTT